MKKINRLLWAVVLGFAAVLCLLDLFLSRIQIGDGSRMYKISLNRIERAIEAFETEQGKAPHDLKELCSFTGAEGYESITGLFSVPVSGSVKQREEFWQNGSEDYAVIVTENNYYKVTYVPGDMSNRFVIILVNGIAALLLLFVLAVLIYIRQKILLPFYQLSQLPYELSKGNLTVPMKENKNKFFGKFVWGMDLLRENLEENKIRELQLQKEKKLLLLSLSHDIKTPLSAIKLYAGALSRNLYKEEAKKQEISGKIKEKVDEIEGYIAEIVRASNEDFLNFQVENRELYIKEVLEQVREYYAEKMELNQIDFSMDACNNCLVWGDLDRLVEVIQNVVENAIKYGDGRKIQITMSREEEEYVISIRNTGCSLEPRELIHIFDSFFRGSNVGKNQGSGLGLYICRQLMHLMEGEITASVEKDGEETVMLVNVFVRLAGS